jgi:hypothetical protein
MSADIQRKPLGFQELTSPVYRCAVFWVTTLTRSQETLIKIITANYQNKISMDPCTIYPVFLSPAAIPLIAI